MPGQGVRDVPAEAFIKAYAAHLKSNDNVRTLIAAKCTPACSCITEALDYALAVATSD